MKLQTSVRKSIEAMTWLTDADAAAVELALTYAQRIDETGDVYIGPHLINVLSRLGGTPEARQSLNIALEKTRGRLAELRSLRTGNAASVDVSAS